MCAKVTTDAPVSTSASGPLPEPDSPLLLAPGSVADTPGFAPDLLEAQEPDTGASRMPAQTYVRTSYK